MNKYIFLFIVLIIISIGCKKSTDDINIKSKDSKVDTQNVNRNNFITHTEFSDTNSKEKQHNENFPFKDNNTDTRKEITTKEVNDYINKTVTVKGYVAQVVMRPKVNYLNFDKKYPDNTFTVVIFPDDMYKFDDLMKYQNKNVKVTGRISLYKGRPQIIVNSTSQIKIIN
ncbi:MAG: hypothetical protein N2490_04190 [Ignavibacteria bacterium]|nr:hypothetical protein [Ignavibacteria bacterium]